MEKMINMAARLSKLCAYCYIYKLFLILNNGKEELPELVINGRNIALLGFFCPFLWFSVLSGADLAIILFHAVHSCIVFLIGVVIMIVGFRNNGKK